MSNFTHDLRVAFKDLGELIILWVNLFKDYNNFIINSVLNCSCKKDMDEETVESIENKLQEMKREHEIEKKLQSDILETASKLNRSLEGLEEILKKLVNEINERKSSYGEVVVQAFETLPEDKKLACFIAFMDTIEKFRQE